MHLPKTVTLAAPVTATYGYRYSIGGTGRSGDTVSLQSLGTSGLVPPRGSTMVRPDGTFVIRATLRSLFTDDGDLAMSARGRYAVASVEGGNATVYGIAGQDTKVVLVAAALRPAAQDRRQAPALLDPHPRCRRPRARGDQARRQDARHRLRHAQRHVLEDDPQARRARQPARRRIGARRRHRVSNATPLSR